MSQNIRITGKETHRVKFIYSGEYKAEPTSRLFGKSFDAFRYNGNVFTVNQEEGLKDLLMGGKVAEINLTSETVNDGIDDAGQPKTKEQLSYLDFITKAQVISEVRFDLEQSLLSKVTTVKDLDSISAMQTI